MPQSPYYRWRPHPWHGLEAGPALPHMIHAYIEITPYDLIKYEVDKLTGYLHVDRPQRTSSMPPTLYGIIPQTYCGRRVGALSPGVEWGDGDPLDVCVVSERPIDRGEIVLTARVVGGIQTIDNGRADDKIVAVLHKDNFWGDVTDISQLPSRLVERLQHYFSTYKLLPNELDQVVLGPVYDSKHAEKVVMASIADYEEQFAFGYGATPEAGPGY
jgi:inorganic pyrophosphatase